jgi:small GTP-binding protein
MLTRKICMIGDFAVGKTSLIARYVRQTFSTSYQTTIGVKIDSKILDLPSGDPLKLVLWDIAGSNALSTVEQSYLKGAAGYLMVVDASRGETLDHAIDLQRQAERQIGPVPFVLVLNKDDLQDRYELSDDTLRQLRSSGWNSVRSSALTGLGVEEAFQRLGEQLAVTI